MDLAFTSAEDIADRVNSGDLDPVAVVETYLDRIAARADVTNAFVTVIESDARDSARAVRDRVEAGEDLPLAGVPIGIKDLADFKEGVRHTMGVNFPCLVAHSNLFALVRQGLVSDVRIARLPCNREHRACIHREQS